MKRKYALLLLLSLLLFSCGQNTPEVKNGKYTTQPEDTTALGAYLFLDSENHDFYFTYDYLSSYANQGSFKFEGKQIIATTEDEKYTFVFDVQDEETLLFREKGSSQIKMIQGEPSVKEGTLFHFTEIKK